MLFKIVGIENQDFTFPDGKVYSGRKIHAIDKDTASQGQIGDQVTVMKISSTHKLATAPLEVGKEYHVYFDQKGRPDFIAEAK